ncbi:MAG TPA: Hpt domain-containing protein [Candidatus Angelobacter sp.]|jgi:HPt (histidine-containing phosphotransfer) domain-containing protein
MEKQEIFGTNQEIIAGTLPSQSLSFSHLKSERFDPQSLWDRVDGDMGLLLELIAVFAEEGPRMLARIDEAISHGSALELEKAGHKMKGSVLQFSASTAAAVAAQLEAKGRSGSLAGADALLYQLRQEVELLQKTLNAMACCDPAC